MRGEGAGSSMGQDNKPLKFEGDDASADMEHEDGQAPASREPVKEWEMEVSVEGAPDRPEPGVHSSNRATAAGACTPCSIVLEDVLDLGLLPLGSFSSEQLNSIQDMRTESVGEALDQEAPSLGIDDSAKEGLNPKVPSSVSTLPEALSARKPEQKVAPPKDDKMEELPGLAAAAEDKTTDNPSSKQDQDVHVKPCPVSPVADVDLTPEDADLEPGTWGHQVSLVVWGWTRRPSPAVCL